MSLSVSRFTALVGTWAVVAPFVFSWRLGDAMYASNVVPGILTILIGAYAGFVPRRDPESPEGQDLLNRATSLMALLGMWMMLSPFFLGLLIPASMYPGTVLPGTVILALSLLNGYYGWRAAG